MRAKLFGESNTRQFRLVRSYRSTLEIVEFAKMLLPDGKEIVPFDRHGRKPHLVQADSCDSLAERMAEDIAALQAEGFVSIAVIAKTAAESKEAYGLLMAKGCTPLSLITKQTPEFKRGVLVIPAYLAKGVEFDAVLIYDASSRAYHRESERKLFYTACTRAMHRLHLYAFGEWTPFIQTVDPSLYTQ